MRRRAFMAGVGSAAAWPLIASGQQQRLPVVGYIDVRPGRYKPSFYQGLSEVGFVDHRNVIVDYREVSEIDELPAIAVEMAQNKVAAIVSATNAIVAAKAVTSTVPLIFIGGHGPCRNQSCRHLQPPRR
jgi:putative tryptophan/tyrosine transport system substrate-binding protein